MVKYRKYRQVLCIQFRVLIQEKTDIAASTVNVHLVKISRTLLQFLQHNLNFNFFFLDKLEKKYSWNLFQTCFKIKCKHLAKLNYIFNNSMEKEVYHIAWLLFPLKKLCSKTDIFVQKSRIVDFCFHSFHSWKKILT